MKNNIHTYFSPEHAKLYSAAIVTQPNGNKLLITHWSNEREVIDSLKNAYPDLIYVGEAIHEFENIKYTKDLITDPNVQYQKIISKEKNRIINN